MKDKLQTAVDILVVCMLVINAIEAIAEGDSPMFLLTAVAAALILRISTIESQVFKD